MLVPTDPLVFSLANNRWIWDAGLLQNFALLPSKAYLRRKVIMWGDCVKLRYGSKPSDYPWLWSHMTSHVTSLARTFEGFRLDNCHSTPLVVGTHMLDAARVVCLDLYVCAELFTGCCLFMNAIVHCAPSGGRLGRKVFLQDGAPCQRMRNISRISVGHCGDLNVD